MEAFPIVKRQDEKAHDHYRTKTLQALEGVSHFKIGAIASSRLTYSSSKSGRRCIDGPCPCVLLPTFCIAVSTVDRTY